MINYAEKGGTLSFRVQVAPRASRSEIVGEHNGALRVRVAAPPVDGAANEELIKTLARAFKVSRRAVQITGGSSAKLKQVSVVGAKAAALAQFSNAEGRQNTGSAGVPPAAARNFPDH